MNSFSGKYRVTIGKINIGADFVAKEVMIENEKVSLQIWDTAGQEKFRALGRAYYRGSDICFFVFDINERSSFLHLPEWIESFFNYANLKEDKLNFPMVLLANKTDLDKRAVTKEEISQLCKNLNGVPYYECSALNGDGVDEAFLESTKKAFKSNVKYFLQRIPKEIGTITKLEGTSNSNSEKKKCCS